MESAEQLKASGNEQLKAGEYQAALQYYDRALAVAEPAAAAPIWSNRSLACIKSGLCRRALHDAERSMLLNRDWCKAHFRRAAAHLKCNEPVEALLAAKTALDTASTAAETRECENVIQQAIDAAGEEEQEDPSPPDLSAYGDGICFNSKVAVRPVEGAGLGVVALEPILAGETVITVQHHAMLSHSTVGNEEHYEVIQQLAPSRLSIILLTACVALSDSSSQWHRYFSTQVPRHLTLPLFFSASELTELQAPVFADEVSWKHTQKLAEEYRQVLQAAMQCTHPSVDSVLQHLSWERFKWAFGLHLSRSLPIYYKTNEGEPDGAGHNSTGFMPGMDILNTGVSVEERQTAVELVHTDDSVKTVCVQPLAKGDQVLLNYTNRPNKYWLLNFGFVPSNNPDERVQIDLLQEPSQPHRQLLDSVSDDHLDNFCVRLRFGFEFCQMSDQMCACLWVASKSEQQVNELLDQDVTLLREQKLWRNVEPAHLQLLSKSCCEALEAYATTCEQDEQLLEMVPVASNIYWAVIYRLERKRVLVQVSDKSLRELERKTLVCE